MTQEQHYDEYKRLRTIAQQHLNNAIESKDGFDRAEYQEYKSNMKQANKHRGISQSMWTRSIKRLYGTSSN